MSASRDSSGYSQLLQAISNALPDLRNSERKVAETVLADPSFALEANVAGLARASNVSEPTVIRFCSALGFDGFSSFKLRLAQAVALGLPISQSAIGIDDTIDELTAKIFDHSINALDQARKAMDTAAVGAAVQAILAGREILFVGFGASGIIAQDAQQKFALFGRPCAAPIDLHQQYIAASTSSPDTVVVAISNTGTTAAVIDVARRARERGATVIGVTGTSAPLLAECDISLIVRTDEDTDLLTPTVSRLAGLVLIDVLATSVAMALGVDHLHNLSTMKESLAQFRSNESETKTDPDIDRPAASVGRIQEEQ
jgi:RpiR family carbohydrate utilization transcriptional regulator